MRWFLGLSAMLVGVGIFCASAHAALFINEIDYDQPGVDSAEFIELAGTAGTNLNGWTIQLMNGADNLPYGNITLPSFTFTDETGTGWGFFVAGRPSVPGNDFDLGADNSVQNGTSDGMQLIDPSSAIVQYVEYAGTALTGPNDISPAGIVDGNVLANTSIYKTGMGSAFGDFSWDNQFGMITPGALNPGETLTAVPEPVGLLVIGVAILAVRRTRRAVGL
jgi:hypothetical protein